VDDLFRRSIAWPSDHGSWVFLLSPLIIGLVAGGRWTTPVVYLIVAALSGFLIRQPTTIAVKALSGRRSRQDLPAALFWTAVYGAIGSLHVLGLVLRGFGYILYLAIPGLAVWAWYLYLVWRREERRQRTMEILGAGVLALTAPAGLWAGLGHPDPKGWLLWILIWAQSAASIVYVYLRLQQRTLPRHPGRARLLGIGGPAIAFATLNLLAVAALSADNVVSAWLFLAYLPQWIETLRGSWLPALHLRPAHIGYRQVVVSTLFTLIFVMVWGQP